MVREEHITQEAVSLAMELDFIDKRKGWDKLEPEQRLALYNAVVQRDIMTGVAHIYGLISTLAQSRTQPNGQ
jgi:hypothetical protein